MNDENSNIHKNETFTWLEPGAWRSPFIVSKTKTSTAYLQYSVVTFHVANIVTFVYYSTAVNE